MAAYEKFDNELLIVTNANQNLQKRMLNLEKQLSKSQQCNRCNNVKISGISNEVWDAKILNKLWSKSLKDSGIDVNPLDMEGCHILPLGWNATNATKLVIMKFVNRKHSEATLWHKKDINQKSKVFVSHSLCRYYQFLWGKCKELQRKGQINQVFCLGDIVMVRITENSPAIRILHEKDLVVCQECPPESV